MKKLLNLFGIVTLIGTNTVGLTSCQNKLTPEELSELKIKNKINTANEKIKANLEWRLAEEQPFYRNGPDEKWYIIIVRKNIGDDWSIVKFKYHEVEGNGFYEIDKKLTLWLWGWGLYIKEKNILWSRDLDKNYFKAVYRWNLDTDAPALVVDVKTGEVKVSEE